MSDKLNKNINESMLEGLLSDEDKPKPPKPVTPTYYRGGAAQGHLSYGRGSSYYDDEEYDRPLYNPAGRSTYVPPRSAAPTSYSSGFDISAATINAIKTALSAGVNSGQKYYFLPNADLLANALVRGIGELMDAVGLSFGASGSKAAKALVVDMIATNMFYNTPAGGYKELDFGDADSTDFDPDTGEIFETAIRDVDGGFPPADEEM